MNGTLIYKFNGISIYLLHGVYTLTDGKESVAMIEMPCLDTDVLKKLLQDKAGIDQLISTAVQVKEKKQSVLVKQVAMQLDHEYELENFYSYGY